MKSLDTAEHLPPNTLFKIDLDLFITEDSIARICKLRTNINEIVKVESKSFLKTMPDPTSMLLFYVLPADDRKNKPRRTFELDLRKQQRTSNSSTSHTKKGSINSTLRFDSTMHTIKQQSPPTKPGPRNSKILRKPGNSTSNGKLQSQMRSTIMKMADNGDLKYRPSLDGNNVKGLATSQDPYKHKQGLNLYQVKSKLCELISNK